MACLVRFALLLLTVAIFPSRCVFSKEATTTPLSRAFPASGVSTVLFRASAAESASVSFSETNPPSVTVSAKREGGASGYHSADPNWRETPASEWGLDFVARTSGSTLIISSKNEIGYIHHHYTLEQIHLTLPKGVRLVRETRKLTGDGAPNLGIPRLI